ncbi:MAG: tRNA-binding protein [Lutibacter sp.]|jgi:tRNA-binding protein|nr:tRNA-binding protein [Lutibacter sp.]
MTPIKPTIEFEDFKRVDIRCGTILKAAEFPAAHKAAYQLQIDFGTLGILKSSAQITALYSPESLIGRKVLAVVNFEAKQIAHFMSECLVLGLYKTGEDIVLLQTSDNQVVNGTVVQ